MRSGWLVLLAVCAAVAGCTARQSAPVVIAGWHELAPPAAGARVVAIVPDGRGLLVTGSVPGPNGRAPGAWTTTDARTWHAIPLHPHTYYAGQAELVAVGLAGGRITALGQAFGGAHSNPRPTVWAGDANGLVEYEQPFEMFGGPDAIGVNDEAALPGTALLVGQWSGSGGRYGAAVWVSADGATWQRDASDPALASAPGEQTSALGASVGPQGFLVAGDTQQGTALVPLLWTSPDGRTWRRNTVPAATDGVEADRVGCDRTGCVLAGSAVSDHWQAVCWPVGAGGTVGPSRPGPSGDSMRVSQVLPAGNDVYDALQINNTARLELINRDCSNWRDVRLPVGSAEVRVGELPAGLLLATTDQNGSRLWLRSR